MQKSGQTLQAVSRKSEYYRIQFDRWCGIRQGR
jgi:hypothetical protein